MKKTMIKTIKGAALVTVLCSIAGLAFADSSITLSTIATNTTDNLISWKQVLAALFVIIGSILVVSGLFCFFKHAQNPQQQGGGIMRCVLSVVMGSLMLFSVAFSGDVATSALGTGAKSDASAILGTTS